MWLGSLFRQRGGVCLCDDLSISVLSPEGKLMTILLSLSPSVGIVRKEGSVMTGITVSQALPLNLLPTSQFPLLQTLLSTWFYGDSTGDDVKYSW